MRDRHHCILLSLIALSALISAGCQQREIICLGDDAIPLEVAFEWHNAPKANPEGMTLYFYSSDGAFRRFDITGREGGRIELPPGHYDLVAVNNDLPGVRIEGYEGYHSICAVAQSTGSPPVEDFPPVRPTGMLYGGVVNDVEVTMCGVSYRRPDGTLKECPRGLIRCSPDSMARVYNVSFLNVKGLERISKAEATLSGMASELLLCDDIAGSDACCVSFPLDSLSGQGDLLRGHTSGFGAPDNRTSISRPFMLTIRVKLKTGKIYSKTYDVTAQVENFLHRNNIIIIIKDLDIPYDPSEEVGDGGFDVGVGDWNTVIIDL